MLATRAIDIVAGFIDLPSQRLALFRRQPSLAAAVRLAARLARTALAVLALLASLIRRVSLVLRISPARFVVLIPLLRQPIRGARKQQQG